MKHSPCLKIKEKLEKCTTKKTNKEDKAFHLVNDACSDNFDVIDWPVLSAGFHHPYSLQNADSLRYSSKNTVLSIQPLSGCKRKKELASVCIWSSVGHRQNTSTWQTYKWRLSVHGMRLSFHHAQHKCYRKADDVY